MLLLLFFHSDKQKRRIISFQITQLTEANHAAQVAQAAPLGTISCVVCLGELCGLPRQSAWFGQMIIFR